MIFGTLRDLLFSLIWPAAAAVSLAVAVGGKDVTALGLILLACGTMAGYGLDRLIDRRDLDSPATRRALFVGVILTSLATAVLACTHIWRFTVCAVLGVMAGGYVPLKRMIPKNMLTVPAWTIAVCALPFAEAPEFGGYFAGAAGAVALIMLANTVLCDLPNVEEDRLARVRAITVWFGVGIGATLAGTAAVLGTLSAMRHNHLGLAITAAALLPLAILMGIDPHRRGARQAVDLVVTVFPGPITLLHLWLQN